MGYVDGSTPAPPKQVPSSTTEGVELVSNPVYDRWDWDDQDQLLLTGLLRYVIMTKTARDAWDILNRMFASASRARVVQIRVELATTKKRNLSMDDYFRKIKRLASEMVAVDAPLRNDEVVAYLLAGLDADYDSFVTSMATKSGALTLDAVYGDLMSYDARQLQHQVEACLHVGNSANYEGRGSTLVCCGHGVHGGPPHGPSRGPHRGGAARVMAGALSTAVTTQAVLNAKYVAR
jgi:hypothetical protein